jgi:hypothetical protein
MSDATEQSNAEKFDKAFRAWGLKPITEEESKRLLEENFKKLEENIRNGPLQGRGPDIDDLLDVYEEDKAARGNREEPDNLGFDDELSKPA